MSDIVSIARTFAPAAADAAAATVAAALTAAADRLAAALARVGPAGERAAEGLGGPWWTDQPAGLLPTVPTPAGDAVPVGLAVADAPADAPAPRNGRRTARSGA